MKLDKRFLPLLILGLGLILRIYAAISHLDISHPDEHFQTLEPASHVVYGFGWLSWEWTTGTRSWFVPGLYVPLLWLLKLIGIQGGMAPIVACRVFMAILSTAALTRFWTLLRESGFKRGASLTALALFAMTPACVAWGAMTLSDVWALIFLWCSLPTVLRAVSSGEDLFLAGALLGLSFLARIQMAIWPIGMLLVFMLRRPFPWRMIGRATMGYGAVVLFQGALDWLTWGFPFESVILNVKKNLLEHVAAFYGTSPFYDYFLSVPSHLGWVLVAAIFLIAVLAWILKGKRLTERDALILVPAALYLLIHSAIAHKELRFMFPVIPVFFYLLAWGLSAFDFSAKLREDLCAAVLLLAALVGSGFIYSDQHTYSFDLSDLTRAIHEDGGLKNGGCLVLLDHYWIWSRGEMMIGASIRFIELSSQRPMPEEASHCAYAITLPGRDSWFLNPYGSRWQVLKKDSHGQILMKRVLTKS